MKFVYVFLLALFSLSTFAQDFAILPQKKQSEVIDQWLGERLETVLPEMMDRADIDMWLVISREYNEDPVIKTLLPSTWLAARRRTILVMYKPNSGKEVEKLAVARYNVGEHFKKAWDPETQPDQWKRLVELIKERNPKKIGINISDDFGHADGLNHTEYELLLEYLPKSLQKKLTSAEELAVGWLETRTPSEMATYKHIQSLAHDIIQEGLSEKVITPGVTSTTDVVWWYRDRIKELGLETWFHPTVDIQRASNESKEHLRTFDNNPDPEVIMPGDVLHMDFGITYLRLNTDTQELAYVLKPDEKEVPQYLVDALAVGNRLQDILTTNYKTGRTGNEILRAARAQMKAEDINGTIYTHPMGYHGHAAGPTIGMWDNQGDTPGSGDYTLYPNTVYAIELNAEVYLEEWQKPFRVMLEEDAYFDGEEVIYLNGRQKEFLTIPRQESYLKD
ncbi:M24 family metallopeptidase [Psychroflexus montanilacus]|uniref:M24 family metallopeptidase n=1 Tax=Psychroflexus montanilacus TaxID=2873598 RepID=UPI001CCC5C4C|nr:M24 family metallopeptidase [Psychroflexus montanilacus]MBZ9652593.1 aminopeptidase P family protein [Psychroflexus montanilacus]